MILLSSPIAWLLSILLTAALANGIDYPFTETSGGDGGTEFEVTSVGDDEDDTSTLRGAIAAAIDSGGPSVITFNIPCTGPKIELESPLEVEFAKRLTIDGSNQEGGVTVVHHTTVFRASKHVVLRHLRFRPGRLGVNDDIIKKCGCEYDADDDKCKKAKCGTGDDALTVFTSKDFVVEHCSFGLGSDESLSVEGSRRVIVRRNIIGSGITDGGEVNYKRNGVGAQPTADYHNKGSLLQGNDDLVLHDNLWSGFNDRCPQIVSSNFCCFKGAEDSGEEKLLDEDDQCSNGRSLCWGQRPSPKIYLFNNVIKCASTGTELKALRGQINMWKNVYLGKKNMLKNSISKIDGSCSKIESEGHAFEKKFRKVDNNDTRDYPKGGQTVCGNNPDKDGMDDDLSVEDALDNVVDLAGALPEDRDDFDEDIIEDLKNDNFGEPVLDGDYDDPVNDGQCN